MPYLKTFNCGLFETNAYLAAADNSESAVLIDAPPESFETICAALKKDKKKLEALLITHSHIDHILDAAKIAAMGVPIIAYEGSEHHIAHPDTLDIYPAELVEGARVTHTVRDGEKITLAGLKMEVLFVPGHCDYSAAFYMESDSLCFVGDAVFKGSVGRTDLTGGNFDLLATSICNKIYTLPDNVILLSGHGPATTVGDEKNNNPFVRG